MREYAFDLKLFTTVRIKATSEEMARRILRDHFDAIDINAGEIAGETIVCEASMDGEADLIEIDGEAV